jgi:hypothetical protein
MSVYKVALEDGLRVVLGVTEWLSVTATPTSGVGKEGDWALNINNAQVFQKTDATTWTLKLTLSGEGGGGTWGSITGTLSDQTDLNSALSGKQATLSDATASVTGKMTAAYAAKLDGIAAGAEVNVPADWNATTGDAAIANKPTLGTAAAAPTTDFAAASHNQAASTITSGTLDPARLASGSALQVFRRNAANDAIECATVTAGGGSVTEVTGTAPITVATGTTTPAISFTQSSTARLVTDTEKTTWNGKQDALADATASVTGKMTSTYAAKLDGIAAGAEVNVNADWNAVSGDAQILNKPTLGTAAAAATTDFAAASHNQASTTITFTDVTTGDASTTAHGFAPKATAPASGLLSVLGIGNGETVRSDKALFDSTTPAALGTAAAGTSLVAARRDHVHAAPIVALVVASSDETTALTAGTAKLTFRMPYAMTLSAVRASVNTAPTGSTLIVDINEGGTTILSTKLSIDASAKTSVGAASAAVISDAALADNAEITIDLDQVGSTIAGAGLKVTLIGYLA